MNICMVSTDFVPNVGGVAAHVLELSKALVRLGHAVHVVQARFGEPGTELSEIDGVRVHRLTFHLGIKYVRKLKHLLATRRYIHNLVESEGIDVIHWHQLLNSSLETKVLSGDVPRIFTNHSSTFLQRMETARGRLHMRWLIGHADYVISPSEELHEQTGHAGFSDDVRTFIPNGVDCDRFSPDVSGAEIRDKHGIPHDSVLAVCARRLVPKNGVIYLAKAAAGIRAGLGPGKMKILITCREFSEGPAIAAEIERNGSAEDVILTESIPNEEIPLYYAASDVVVLPSLMEAVSITALEAMATGKPVVSTDVGGLPFIVKPDETGLLVPPRDPDALAEALIRIAKSELDRKRMGETARHMVERAFSWNVIAQRTLSVYQEVLASFTRRNS